MRSGHRHNGVLNGRRTAVAVTVLFLWATGPAAGVALADSGGIPDADGVYYGCYKNHHNKLERQGELRVVASPDLCRDNEIAVSWSQQGPEGPRGETGPEGPEGPQGPEGPPGLPAEMPIAFGGPAQCRPVLPAQLPSGGTTVGQLHLFRSGIDLGAFARGYGFGSCSEVVFHKVVDPTTGAEKVVPIPGANIIQDPVLRRVVTSDMGLYDWRQQVVAGDLSGARSAASLIISDPSLHPAWAVQLADTWPSHHSVSTVGTPSKVTENATLAAEDVLQVRREGELPAQAGLHTLTHGSETDLFETVDAVGSENAVVLFTSGGGGATHKLAGTLSQDFVVLRRGLTDDTGWADWRQMVQDGDITGARQDVVLTLRDDTASEIVRYNILNAWPAGYSIGFENGAAVEQLVLVHEGFALQEAS
jgi:phage tail-like protein